jgi:hypothetical protein
MTPFIEVITTCGFINGYHGLDRLVEMYFSKPFINVCKWPKYIEMCKKN